MGREYSAGVGRAELATDRGTALGLAGEREECPDVAHNLALRCPERVDRPPIVGANAAQFDYLAPIGA